MFPPRFRNWSLYLSDQIIRLALLLLLGVFLSTLYPTHAQQALPTKRVLVLYWYNKDYLGNILFEQNFLPDLQKYSQAKIEYYPEYLETNRFPGDQFPQLLHGFLQKKYADRPIDVVVAISDPSVDFMLKYRADLFPNTPIVFAAVRRPSPEQLAAGPGLTGFLFHSTIRQTLDLALTKHPGTKEVFVISGKFEGDRRLETNARNELQGFENKVKITYLTDLPLDELIAKTSSLPQDSLVVYIWQQSHTKEGQLLETYDTLAKFAPTTSVPIYGMASVNVGRGIVGGYVTSSEANGAKAAEMVLQILNGKRAQEIAVEPAPALLMFDWRQLHRWNIDERSLPPGSDIRFRPYSFWQVYKWHILGVSSLFILETLLIAYLLINRSRRRKAELERERFALLAVTEHKHLNEIVSNVPGIVWENMIDPETNELRTTFISDYAEKMLGYSTEEWLSSTPALGLKIMHEEDRETVLRESEAVIKTGKEGNSRFRWRAKDGRILWVNSSLRPIIDADGKIIGLRGVTIDITEKTLAEQAKRETEQENQAILEAIPDLMFLQTRDGVYLDFHVSDPTELFVPPEQFLGKTMREVLPAELAESFRKRFLQAEETGKPQILEYKLPLGKGERWYEARIVRYDHKILSVVRNITERKQAEQELREATEISERQRAQLEAVFQTVDEGIVVSDMAGNLLLVNQAEARINGYESADEMKQNLDYFTRVFEVEDEDGSVIPHEEWPLSRVLRGEIISDCELRARRKDNGLEGFFSFSGEPILDEHGKQILALLVTRDITADKKAEEQLRLSEARFRNMADNAPVMIWLAGPDKHRTYFNKQWLDFTGHNIEEEVGDGWTRNLHPDDCDRVLEICFSALPFTVEYRLRRADGAYRWVIETGTPRFSTSGDFLGYIGSCVDITERKESEQVLHELLEEVSRLKNQLQEENIYLKEEISLERDFGEIIGESDALKYVLFKIQQVAPTESTVLITGETGTGKELVARAIHDASERRERPLVKVNCGALSSTLIESELFGHEKGAFTGAATRKIGRFELADGATIFLDEIGELPPDLQVKLLRVIQEGEFERLGSSRTTNVDVRIIAATNRNLEADVRNGLFREDLWYRLNVFPITVPPLRQRREDIPLLVEHFVRRFAGKLGKVITSVSPTTLNNLSKYSWPGNVRELANVIERAAITAQGSVLRISDDFGKLDDEQLETSKTLEELERDYIVAVLTDTAWRIEGPRGAARILGMNPSTLRTRMVKLGIQKPEVMSKTAR